MAFKEKYTPHTPLRTPIISLHLLQHVNPVNSSSLFVQIKIHDTNKVQMIKLAALTRDVCEKRMESRSSLTSANFRRRLLVRFFRFLYCFSFLSDHLRLLLGRLWDTRFGRPSADRERTVRTAWSPAVTSEYAHQTSRSCGKPRQLLPVALFALSLPLKPAHTYSIRWHRNTNTAAWRTDQPLQWGTEMGRG